MVSRVVLYSIHVFDASAGIWDCMSSQDVINFIRRTVYQGKELREVSELMCDYCLGPDASSTSLGSDNMTVVIVAILNGRTKDEWYSWIHDRVETNYGYETPSQLPRTSSRSVPAGTRRPGRLHKEWMFADESWDDEQVLLDALAHLLDSDGKGVACAAARTPGPDGKIQIIACQNS